VWVVRGIRLLVDSMIVLMFKGVKPAGFSKKNKGNIRFRFVLATTPQFVENTDLHEFLKSRTINSMLPSDGDWAPENSRARTKSQHYLTAKRWPLEIASLNPVSPLEFCVPTFTPIPKNPRESHYVPMRLPTVTLFLRCP
jgi:hypothetical protein